MKEKGKSLLEHKHEVSPCIQTTHKHTQVTLAPHVSKTLPFAFIYLFCTTFCLPTHPSVIHLSFSFCFDLIRLGSFWCSSLFPSNSCSILYLFQGHLVLPISLLCQRSRLHLSQTIITAASTAGSKSLVGERWEGEGGVEEPAGASLKANSQRWWREGRRASSSKSVVPLLLKKWLLVKCSFFFGGGVYLHIRDSSRIDWSSSAAIET